MEFELRLHAPTPPPTNSRNEKANSVVTPMTVVVPRQSGNHKDHLLHRARGLLIRNAT